MPTRRCVAESPEGVKRGERGAGGSSPRSGPQPQHVAHGVETGRTAAVQRAARSAPAANTPRSNARWLSAMCSLAPANSSVCSPTTCPPRSAAKPIAPAARTPVCPSRPLWRTSSRATPRPAATARPSAIAVPDGASTFCRWCISTISASYASPGSAAASVSANASRTVTPGAKLAAYTTAIRAAARRTSASASAERPEVPSTQGVPARASAAAWAGIAAALVKSITASQAAARAAISGNSATSCGGVAALPGRSVPPATRKEGSARTAATSSPPMRPATPAIPISISVRLRGPRVRVQRSPMHDPGRTRSGRRGGAILEGSRRRHPVHGAGGGDGAADAR